MSKVRPNIQSLGASRLGVSFEGAFKAMIECDQSSANAITFGPANNATLPIYVGSSRVLDCGDNGEFDDTKYDIIFGTAAGQNIGTLILFYRVADKPVPGSSQTEIKKPANTEIHNYVEDIVHHK